MIKSMTGYGRAKQQIGDITVSVEIKSVNHRYFEFSPKLHRNFAFLEDKLKNAVQNKVSRGKIECIVQIDAPEAEEAVVQLNISLAKAYIDAFTKLSEEFGIENDIKLSDLALKTDIFTVHKEPANEELIWNAVSQVLDEAIDAFVAMRETEGKQLSEDIASRCDIILKFVEEIDQRSPIVVSEYFEKLAQRIKELLHDAKVDEQRLLTEAAVFADKTAVTEETVRLRSHIDQMKSLLNSCEPVGRKMDFLVQEMNREANTIGSKCQDTAIASLVINIKAEIEKIREQIQNIE
ncbi:MAG: YicC family protein [Clostridiales bacterium]|jgi:uncharacterized protein (TIGR00255 family)|nr:YicC family protein [Clostridiales bacterium]HOA34187.1 YicC family protein [Clostridiales bacterium]HOJ35455.1 YicC family protein [Clostridiales bacterium]HPU67510.1 YicC family protein [Clostridiales bacterium]HQA05424.1 YicC family protein [Clostridiales bacterium]